MSFLREMGLAAALLAATGGAAIATWSYISARRRKEAGRDWKPPLEEPQKTEEPSTVPHSTQDSVTRHCVQGTELGDSDIQRGGGATGQGTVLVPEYGERAGGTYTVQGDRASAVQVEGDIGGPYTVQGDRASAVQVEGDIGGTYTVQGDRASAVQVEGDIGGTYTVQGDRASAVQVEGDIGGPYTVQEDKGAEEDRSAVQVEVEKECSAHTLQVNDKAEHERSAVQVEVEKECSTHTVQDDRRSAVQVEVENKCSAHTVQDDRRSQPERSAVQVEVEEECSAHTVQGDRRSAVQVEVERECSAHTVQDDRRSQPERSAVQVEREIEGSAHIVQGDSRSQPEGSAVQVEGERAHSKYTVQVDRKTYIVQEDRRPAVQVEEDKQGSAHTVQEGRSELHTSHVEPPIIKELSDSDICTKVQPQVKASLRKQVVVIGHDGSGKTSVLNSIAAYKGKFVTTPTAGVNALCVQNGTSKMEFLEIGGSEHLRPYWKMYLSRAFAVIFVVDSADHGRLPLAKRHLHQLIQQDALIPLMVLANKQDLKNAYHITDIHEALGLSDICENRKLFLIGTYATKEESEVSSGILDAKEFLAQLLSESSAKTS
ncbi:ADP-ribosylation factor-like protein 9 isoform X19 [Rana temporaria]|uniref:ADP-ribosylation factor-like protein 9 isoform X19 n=1 Tax=Rana temporaria TaxID=8407 RepID=UPI001AACD999|nr:ADP-ribosylation factor-like protein 9 isoform X19 [Rana temporaria]